jgi:hypothetical protein
MLIYFKETSTFINNELVPYLGKVLNYVMKLLLIKKYPKVKLQRGIIPSFKCTVINIIIC